MRCAYAKWKFEIVSLFWKEEWRMAQILGKKKVSQIFYPARNWKTKDTRIAHLFRSAIFLFSRVFAEMP